MLRRIPTLFLCLLFAIALPACDSDGDGDGNGNGNGNGSGSNDIGAGIGADIDGERFAAAFIAAASRDDTDMTVALGGSSINGETLVLAIAGATTGTYPIDNNAGTVGSYSRVNQAGTNAEVFSTAFAGGTGTVTITDISAARVEGTFSFTASSSAGNTVTVTNGRFDVAFIE